MNSNAIEKVLIQGDLSQLSERDRAAYYSRVCESLGLNPLTQPFAYIRLQGKLILYARREATEQLRANRKISIQVLGRETDKELGIHAVYVRATDKDGRVDENLGVVSIAGMKGEQLANALMKAHTKGVRRVTLSLCGLGLLDESEIETIPGAIPQPAKALPPSTPNVWRSWKSP